MCRQCHCDQYVYSWNPLSKIMMMSIGLFLRFWEKSEAKDPNDMLVNALVPGKDHNEVRCPTQSPTVRSFENISASLWLLVCSSFNVQKSSLGPLSNVSAVILRGITSNSRAYLCNLPLSLSSSAKFGYPYAWGIMRSISFFILDALVLLF